MHLKLGLLGLFVAALPLSVDIPASRDSAQGHETRFAVAGDIAQFSIIQRGCEGQILSEARTQIHTGALEVEHEFPNNVVIGVRGGKVSEDFSGYTRSYYGQVASPSGSRTNAYANPYVAIEGRLAGVGVGWLHADHGFMLGEQGQFHPEVTGHLRFGTAPQFRLRYMEDFPIESEGYLSMDLGFPTSPISEVAFFAGLAGPYDGGLLGIKGHVWLTPQAALQVRAGVAGHGQYSIGAGAKLRLRGR